MKSNTESRSSFLKGNRERVDMAERRGRQRGLRGLEGAEAVAEYIDNKK